MTQTGSVPSYAWLGVGMAVGLALALYSLLATQSPALPEAAVARVNDTLITQDDYRRALDAVASDRRQPLTEADRRRILGRLVDEELLVQYALHLGLTREVPLVRTTLVSAVLDAHRAHAEALAVSPQQARAFYDAHRAYFTRAHALHLRAWRSTDRAAAERAAAVLREGGSPGGDPDLSPLPAPDGLVPASRLATYIGRELAEIAQTLPQDAVSEVLTVGEAYYIVQVIARVDGEAPPFETVEAEVVRELKRRAAEDGLRHLLDGLRESGDVRIADVP